MRACQQAPKTLAVGNNHKLDVHLWVPICICSCTGELTIASKHLCPEVVANSYAHVDVNMIEHVFIVPRRVLPVFKHMLHTALPCSHILSHRPPCIASPRKASVKRGAVTANMIHEPFGCHVIAVGLSSSVQTAVQAQGTTAILTSI
jgi:hypothetical protein